MTFRFVDLFAGIGGFHAAMKALGGECVYAVEIDERAAAVYEANWGHSALGDVTKDADDDLGVMTVPEHDVLCAGFPCQPFSKSGAQRGMDEARGTLFFNIASIIKAHHPAVVLLENVRNLVGPRHEHEWDVIIQTLREEGYNVSAQPAIFSPHLLPAWMGGTPQVRERVFITATYAPDSVPRTESGDIDFGAIGPVPVATMQSRFPSSPGATELFSPAEARGGWNLLDSGILDETRHVPGCDLTATEILWIDAWDEFSRFMREVTGEHLRGFPYWADSWVDFPEVARFLRSVPVLPKPRTDPTTGRFSPVQGELPAGFPSTVTRPRIDPLLPAWKKSHLRRNYDAFEAHWQDILVWAYRWGLYTDLFPASRRKLEWQAQDSKSLWDTLMHFRPSGIRAKRPTYVPALVAITQTTIVGPLERRLSPRETARLQGLPDQFVFPRQTAAATYKQMGNGVSVGAVWHIMRKHVLRDRDLLVRSVGGRLLVDAVQSAPADPAERLAGHVPHVLTLEGVTRDAAP